MDVTANNIAKVDTKGFKKNRADLQKADHGVTVDISRVNTLGAPIPAEDGTGKMNESSTVDVAEEIVNSYQSSKMKSYSDAIENPPWLSHRNKLKLKIIFILILFFGIFGLAKSSRAAAENIYVSQSGNGDGSSCNSPKSAAWFNTDTSWGIGANLISPGDTVHLCGTFNFAANDNTNGLLRARGSGTAESPITILFEPNAILQSPQFSTYGAIMLHAYQGCYGYIIVDGGTNGIIQNTANGTGLTYHAASRGVFITGWTTYAVSHVEVKNLTIRNIYLNQGTAPSGTDTDGQSTEDILIAGRLDNISIHDNTFNNARTGIGGSFDGDIWTNIDIYNNFIGDHCWGMSIAGLSVPSNATNVTLHNNEITDWTNWQCPAEARGCTDKTDVYHTDGIITWSGNTPGTPVYAPKIYNNYIHGDLGAGSPTAFIYCTVGNPIFNSVSGSECIVYNNLLVNIGGAHSLLWFGCNTKNNKVYNNTIIGSSNTSSFNPCIISSSLGGDVYKNNICQTFGQIFFTQWSTTGAPETIISAMDNNVYYNIGNPIINAGGTSYTLAQWQALGYDLNSLTSNPNLDGSYKLQAGSPAIGAGANLTSVGITSDKAGVARPSTGAWAIGAYEYVSGGGDTTPPAAPTGLAVN